MNRRFALIEAILELHGGFRRVHLQRAFDLGPATATRVIADYCDMHPGAIELDGATKSYRKGMAFQTSELDQFAVNATRFYDAACVLAGGPIVQFESRIR
jgi:hypothetical protein